MSEARSQKPEATARRSAAGSAALSLWLPVAAYMAFIFALSSISHTPAMPGGADKILHALLYSGLGFLAARAFGGGRPPAMRAVVAAVVVGAIYGVSDEVHQYFNPPRAVEAADVFADTVGSAVGAGVLYAWGIIRGRDGL